MMRHPGRKELFAYAEDLVSGRPIAARVGRHVTACTACRAEVEQARRSLEFAASAPELEPSEALTASILQAARHERSQLSHRRTRVGLVWGTMKGAACAASLALMSVMYFNVTSSDASLTAPSVPTAAPVRLSETPTPELLEKAGAEIVSLSAAVGARLEGEQSLLEQVHRRAVLEQEEDLTAAMAALKRNPGNERARKVLNTNIQRGARTLKDIYLEQSL